MTLQSPRSSTPAEQRADRLHRIAIIGRGFTGIMTAIALFKGVTRPFHLVMFDPRARVDLGEGLNQSTAVVLPSRVRDLSVDPKSRDDFRDWLETNDVWRQRQPQSALVGVENAFVPEQVFGAYVYKRFAEALAQRPDVVVQCLPEKVTGLERGPDAGFTVSFGQAQKKHFDAVFLATGYGLREPRSETVVPTSARTAIVVGSGVRAVEQALVLLDAGPASHVSLISSSGLLPQSHTPTAVGTLVLDAPMPRTLRGAFRYLREAASRADAEGFGWQGIMNWFRLQAHDLWEGLTPDERARFKRHVKAIYDSHRHRLPPEHYQKLRAAIENGSITLRKGRVERIVSNGVLLSSPGGDEVLVADVTIDCRFRPPSNDSTLIRSIAASGLARRDELDLGIVVDQTGQTQAAVGRPGALFAMGSLGLGSIADIDQIPQIVAQAHAATAALNERIEENTRMRHDSVV